MTAKVSFLSFLLLILFASSLINTIQASTVSVIASKTSNKARFDSQKIKNKKRRTKKAHKKQLKSRLKPLKNNQTSHQNDAGATFIKVFAIAWYPISIGLLITALVLRIAPLLIASIVLLALPVFCAIVIGLIFLISLMTFHGSLC